jgi:hypothetical protein
VSAIGGKNGTSKALLAGVHPLDRRVLGGIINRNRGPCQQETRIVDESNGASPHRVSESLNELAVGDAKEMQYVTRNQRTSFMVVLWVRAGVATIYDQQSAVGRYRGTGTDDGRPLDNSKACSGSDVKNLHRIVSRPSRRAIALIRNVQPLSLLIHHQVFRTNTVR